MRPFNLDLVAPQLQAGPISWSIRYELHVDSTQDLARAAARAGALEGWTVVTDWQRAGRGRLGRRWLASPGCDLLFSSVLRPAATLLSLLPLVAGLAVAEGLRTDTGLEVGLKWPNDILVDRRKLAGILLERGPGDGVVLGVGINVNSAAVDLPPDATSLAIALHHAVGRERLLAAILDAVGRAYARVEQEGSAWVLPAWRTASSMLGQRVSYEQDGQTLTAVAEDVEPDGALRVRLADGTQRRLYAGDVHPVRS